MYLTVLVCGGRDYLDERRVYAMLDDLRPSEVVHGGCPTGADAFAGQWAKDRRIPCTVFEADWKQYGKAAGPKRNQLMLDVGGVDIVLAFPGGSGTWDMVTRVRKGGYHLICL